MAITDSVCKQITGKELEEFDDVAALGAALKAAAETKDKTQKVSFNDQKALFGDIKARSFLILAEKVLEQVPAAPAAAAPPPPPPAGPKKAGTVKAAPAPPAKGPIKAVHLAAKAGAGGKAKSAVPAVAPVAPVAPAGIPTVPKTGRKGVDISDIKHVKGDTRIPKADLVAMLATRAFPIKNGKVDEAELKTILDTCRHPNPKEDEESELSCKNVHDLLKLKGNGFTQLAADLAHEVEWDNYRLQFQPKGALEHIPLVPKFEDTCLRVVPWEEDGKTVDRASVLEIFRKAHKAADLRQALNLKGGSFDALAQDFCDKVAADVQVVAVL